MYQQIANGFSSVALDGKAFVFHRCSGNPFLVSDDLFERMAAETIDDSDRSLLADAGYGERDDSPAEMHGRRIGAYIESYRGPAVLDLTISEGCNLGCHMCIHAFSVVDGLPRAAKKIMRFEVARAWIDYYVDQWAPMMKLDRLSFHFGAAEPFLNKDCLLSSLKHISERAAGRDKEVLINSNLTLLDDELLEALVEHGALVSVGLDGLKEENDSIRVDRRRHGTFDVIVANIAKLREAGVHVGVNLTLTDRNIDRVDPYAFLKEMRGLGVPAVLVDIDFVLGVNHTAEEIVDVLMRFHAAAEDLGMELRGNWLAPFYNLTSQEEAEPRSFCASLRGKSVVVTPSGNFSFCTYSSATIAPYDGDPDQSMQGFVSGMKDYMRRFYAVPSRQHCGTCDLLGFCGGGCRVTHEQNGAADLMCGIYRGATAALIRRVYAGETFD
jgi:radical SAM protein with 4Fe4S-binding SPASM domain